ncbi:hypothetical protein CVT26_015267 [Gymnopilus dilepis]|uniref:Uncharacterized protein n=1 Tax=Gymnopilus dilepis TaxID=231916 RepID=A0A409W9W1_9AGAR|nr:hypothetical protein CVT26_015267 [Gymnopilus dilepis]
MYLYYTRFQDDRLMLKLMVRLIAFILGWNRATDACISGHGDRARHYVCICTESYNLAITNFGQPSALVSVSIFVDAALMTSVLITTAVQSYFVERLRNLSKGGIIPAICWILTASRSILLVTMTAKGVLLHQLNAIEVLNRVKAFFTAGLVVGAIVDFSVAGCLAFHIRICKRDAHFPSLSHAMNRVAMWAIEIGLVTGLTELTLLILVCHRAFHICFGC